MYLFFSFTLSQDGTLFRRILFICEDEDEILGEHIKDICLISAQILKDSSEDKIFAINYDGSVRMFDLDGSSTKLSSCLKIRGLHQPKFQSCTSGTNHVILLDSHGEVWSTGARIQSGQFTQTASGQEYAEVIDIIEYFQGVQVLSISSGSDFTVAIVKRLPNSNFKSVETASIRNDSPSCPLGLPIRQNSVKKEKHTSVSSSSDNITEEQEEEEKIVNLRKHSKIADESFDSNDSNQKIERLAKSGLYINPSDAFKFLSQQLSWIRGEETINGIEYRKPSIISVESTEEVQAQQGG